MFYLVILLNLFAIGFLGLVMIEDFPNQIGEWVLMVMFFAVPLMNLLYIWLIKKDDSLVGLWIQVRKKKLRQQLQDED